MQGQKWFQVDVKNAEAKLNSDLLRGLTEEEAERRLSQYGPNALQEPPGQSTFAMFIDQLKEVLVIILIVAAIVSGILGEWADSAVILVIVVLNAILGVYQENKAEQALSALKKMTTPTAKVIRDGDTIQVHLEMLVPGDIVLLETGDSLPADVRLVETASFRTNEAALTGESVPVEKDTGILEQDDMLLGDQSNMAFMGTTITGGRGKGLVVATGMSTQLGKIAQLIQEAPMETTPLQRRLGELGKYLGMGAGVIVAVVFLAGVLQGAEALGMFMIAISLAVAAVPEGLPAVVTIVLSNGVTRMSHRKAVIRRLPAVETLGTVTVICTDKTGTLTKNEMTVTHVYTDGQMFDVTGIGYDPNGVFINARGEKVHPQANRNLMLMLMGGLLDSDARLVKLAEGWKVIGDPTEGALVVAAAKTGLKKEKLEKDYPRLQEIPFDSGRKMMTTFYEIDDALYSFTKGAPDLLLDKCTNIANANTIEPLSPEGRERLLGVNSGLASGGERILALAMRRWPQVPDELQPEQVETELTFIGFFSMIDPARSEVKNAVEVSRKAGIQTVMITGDHRDTALAIAKKLGIWQEGKSILTGEQLQKMDQQGLTQAVINTVVYARVSPEDKLRIVQALKTHNHVVAMTGDGVNDAPALKSANIGVSMGITGTEVAKEASEMVLVDDNYATIIGAVKEGRTIYNNIRKAVHYLLSCNVGEIVAIFTAVLLGLGSPLTAIQILWLNLVTDGLPALALGVEPPENGIMERPPRKPNEGVLAGGMGSEILWQGALIGLTTLSIYYLALHWGRTLAEAHTMAFAIIVLLQLVHAFNVRSTDQSLFAMGVGSNRALVYAILASASLQAAVLFVPFLREFFNVVPLLPADWLVVFILGLIPLLVVEVVKVMRRGHQ